jgi:hypothetical protein
MSATSVAHPLPSSHGAACKTYLGGEDPQLRSRNLFSTSAIAATRLVPSCSAAPSQPGARVTVAEGVLAHKILAARGCAEL